MPSNSIRINCSEELTWYVGDSKMDALIEYLDKIGFRASDDEDAMPSDVSSLRCLQTECQP